MSEDSKNPFEGGNHDTQTRLQAINDQGFVVVVTHAYGPNGEDLMAYDGPQFSGEPGVALNVSQGDEEAIVYLSPFFGDPSKETEGDFESGKRCKLTCPESGAELDPIPGMTSETGASYFAIYLSDRLEEGELVAVSDIWGDTDSRILSEGELLKLYAESEGEDS
ncbi:MAG: hypothetical protein ACQEVA_01865 [Myxococcota bacterium]